MRDGKRSVARACTLARECSERRGARPDASLADIPMSQLRAKLLGAFASFVMLAATAVALAQAVVVVQVRTAAGQPGEAVVTLTPEGSQGAPHTCRTRAGTCRLSNVPPGMYVVTAEPTAGGQAPVPRRVPVVAGGEVTISVTLR